MKDYGYEVLLTTPGDGLLSKEVEKRGIKATKFFLPPLISTRITIGSRKVFNIFSAIYDLIAFFISSISLAIIYIRHKPDIVHTNQLSISIAAGMACRVVGITSIWHLRESISESVPRMVIIVFRFLAFIFADCIICNSVYTATHLKCKLLNKKLKIVYNGINPESSTIPVNNFDVNLLNTLSKHRSIGIFSRITPLKGHLYLIDAIKILRERGHRIYLSIVGGFETHNEMYLSLLKERVACLGMEESILFLGYVKNIYPLLNVTDIVVSTSIEPESFGRTLIEAMSMEKPVVATDIGAHSEIIESGVSGYLIKPRDPDQLADKLEELIIDDELAENMGNCGRVRYERHFTLSKSCQNIKEIYQEFAH